MQEAQRKKSTNGTLVTREDASYVRNNGANSIKSENRGVCVAREDQSVTFSRQRPK